METFKDMNISTLLGNAARTYGTRPAVSMGDEQRFTYSEMYERVVRIAGGLRNVLGLKVGDRVVLAMSNRPQYLEVLFAIWHAGLVAVPVNAKLHAREVAFIIGNCDASLCFVTEEHAEAIASLASSGERPVKVVCVDGTDYSALFHAPITQTNVGRDDLAWLFYTSGTTGRPKGAMLSHLNLQLMAWSYLCDFDHVTDRDSLLHLGPQSHAAGLVSLSFVAKGANNVLPVSGGVDASEIALLINRYENLTFFAAPTMTRRLVDSPDIARCAVEHVRSIVGGGAPFFATDVKRVLEVFGPRFINAYGQGECPCTITGMPKHLYTPDVTDERLVSVGVARSGVDIRIVDAEDREVACGEPGEIVVRSPIVMNGYWKQPHATADAVRDGWLHTGDMGTMDERGFVWLKDRAKDVVISGGSNIYPREVEDVLCSDPGVAEVAVVGEADAKWGEAVVAFVVARTGHSLTVESLDRLCLDNLARYKRPKRYVFLDTLPKNSTGKVLRTELREKLKVR